MRLLTLLLLMCGCSTDPCIYLALHYQAPDRGWPLVETRFRLAGNRQACDRIAVGYPFLDPDDPERRDPERDDPTPPPRAQRDRR